jgi:uncharacterized hydrophobic protein (TIGR00341 family)
MDQRLILLTVGGVEPAELEAYCAPARIVSASRDLLDESRLVVQMTVSTDASERVLDQLQKVLGGREGFQLTLLPVEAVLPRPAEPAGDAASPSPGRQRISREELYQEINASLKVRTTFVTFTLLASIVAAIGLQRNDTAILIGAMVIAPLLGPNVALSLAATLGDTALAARALRINLLGVSLSLAVAVLAGLVPALGITPELDAIRIRSQVGFGDIALALASGTAGVLAFTTGVPSALIGVMVAVALMPPLVAFGMLLGAGYPAASLGPLLLLATNVICLNLAGVLTFMAKGIRPRTWWEAQRAGAATRRAVLVWGLLLLALLVILFRQARLGV